MRIIAGGIIAMLPFLTWGIVVTYNPEPVHQSVSLGEQKVATIKGFRGHDITKKGEEFTLVGEHLDHYQTHDRFFTTALKRENEALGEKLFTKDGIYKEGVYNLRGNVIYERSDGIRLTSQQILIDKQSGRLVGPVAFTLVKNDSIHITGDRFVVYEATKRLHSEGIKSMTLVEIKG